MARARYRVIGKQRCFGVVERDKDGEGIIYDLLESRREANVICAILNEGFGPEWDAVEPIFHARMKEAQSNG